MTTQSRLEKSAITGLLTSTVITGFAATRRHAYLAAAAVRSSAHGQHESVNTILVTGFAATAIAVTVLMFTAATLVAIRRRRRLLQQYGGGTGADRVYSGYRGGW